VCGVGWEKGIQRPFFVVVFFSVKSVSALRELLAFFLVVLLTI